MGLAAATILVRSVRIESIAIYGCSVLIMCAGLLLSASRGGILALGAEIFFLALMALTARSEKQGSGARWKGLVRVLRTRLRGFGSGRAAAVRFALEVTSFDRLERPDGARRTSLQA